MSLLQIKIAPIDLLKEETCEILQSLPKSTKVNVDIIDSELKNNQQEQSNGISFEVLQNLNLEQIAIRYEINNEDSLFSLISLLKQQTALTGIFFKIRASEIEDPNPIFKSLLGALCSPHCSTIDILVLGATPEMTEMSKELVKSNITKEISICLDPLSKPSDSSENLEKASSFDPSTKSSEFPGEMFITDKFMKLEKKFT